MWNKQFQIYFQKGVGLVRDIGLAQFKILATSPLVSWGSVFDGELMSIKID